MTFDVERARADTPGCSVVTHFNNAGAALPPRQVTDAVVDYLRRESLHGGYETEAASSERISAVYAATARLIGAADEEIALLDSATQAWDAAFQSLRLRAGDRILVDQARYPGHALNALQAAAVTGLRVEVVPDDGTGQLDTAELASRLDTDVKLVALTHVPTDSGLVNPISSAGRVCRDAGVPLLVDACQSVGQLRVDVNELGCDLLSGTGRKFLRAPRGTGFLYVRSTIADRLRPPTIDAASVDWERSSPESVQLRAGAKRFEVFERSVANLMGFGAAVDYAASWGTDAIEQRVLALAVELRRRLAEIDAVTVHSRGENQCGIVVFTVDAVPSGEVQRRLHDRGINVTCTRPFFAGAAADDAAGDSGRPKVRASVHYYNTLEEIDRLGSAVHDMTTG